MKIIAFAGSSSTQSINKKLATYAAGLFENGNVEVLDLNDYELPLFSVDKEKELGKPELAGNFLKKMQQADVIVLSLAEHNASFSAAFKNIYDWASRQDKKVFAEKPMLLMATAPGKGGGRNVIEVGKISLPKYGGNIKSTFYLPEFNDNFDAESNRMSNEQYDKELKDIVANFDYE